MSSYESRGNYWELAFACACFVCVGALALLVGTWDYRIAKDQEIERCECKSEIKERQLYASMCQSESIKGPIFKECLYK